MTGSDPGAYNTLRSRSARRTTFALALALLAFVIIPLSATKDWLAGSDYRLVSVNSGNGTVRLVVAGQGDLPPEQDLQDALRGRLLKSPVILEVVPQTRSRFETVEVGSP